MWIVRKPDGQISWLETGTTQSGFEHIVNRHLSDFQEFGVYSETSLNTFLYSTVSQNVPTQITATGQHIYTIAGKTLSIIIGDNGYIVTAYPGT